MPSRQRQNDQRGRGMSGMRGAMSLLGGAAVGAAMMYLFDPERGQARRDQIGAKSGDALRRSRDAIQSVAASASERAGGFARTLAERAEDLQERLAAHADAATDAGESLIDRAAKQGYRLRDRLSDRAGDWVGSARDYLPRFVRGEDERSHLPAALGITAGTLTFLTIGAGAIYFFNSEAGAERRRQFSRRVTNTIGDMGERARSLGQRLRFHHDDLAPDAGGAAGFHDANDEPRDRTGEAFAHSASTATPAGGPTTASGI